ncbi:MAG: hypothetical protein NT069_33155 [Planctomycetota bacterium]|nr:hypothetical protein [Planctomycetota bacterium]
MTILRNTTIDRSYEEWDATTRAAQGEKQTEPTLRVQAIETEIVWDSTDANCTAILTAFNARTSLELVFLDGAISGASSQGLRAKFKVFGLPRSEELASGMTLKVSLKPCYEITNLPTWATMT